MGGRNHRQDGQIKLNFYIALFDGAVISNADIRKHFFGHERHETQICTPCMVLDIRSARAVVDDCLRLLFAVMRQSPDAFARVMAKVPGPVAFLVLSI